MADTLTHNRKWWMSVICKAGVLGCFCCHIIKFRAFTFGAFKTVQILSLHKTWDTTLTATAHRYGSGFSPSPCLQIYYLTVKKISAVCLFFQLCKHCITCSAFLPKGDEKVSDILKLRASCLKETKFEEFWSPIVLAVGISKSLDALPMETAQNKSLQWLCRSRWNFLTYHSC